MAEKRCTFPTCRASGDIPSTIIGALHFVAEISLTFKTEFLIV